MAITGDTRLVFVDASLVLQEIVGNVDAAGDGTVGVDLLHDVLDAFHVTVLLHVVTRVVLDGPTAVAVAVAANVNVVAGLVVASLVVLATLLDEAHLVRVLVDMDGKTAMATLVDLGAVEDNLDGQVVLGPRVLRHILQTIREGGGGCVRPAGPAVLRDMLVADQGDVALSVEVSSTDEIEHEETTSRKSWGALRYESHPRSGDRR